MFSRKVFCGATSPLFPPGIVRLCVLRCTRQVATLCAWSLCRWNREAHGNVASWQHGSFCAPPARSPDSKRQSVGTGSSPRMRISSEGAPWTLGISNIQCVKYTIGYSTSTTHEQRRCFMLQTHSNLKWLPEKERKTKYLSVIKPSLTHFHKLPNWCNYFKECLK